jgi:hypothetical protein
MRESPRQDHHIGGLEVRVLVPDVLGTLANHVRDRMIGIVIAVGSGKDNDRELHLLLPWGAF